MYLIGPELSEFRLQMPNALSMQQKDWYFQSGKQISFQANIACSITN